MKKGIPTTHLISAEPDVTPSQGSVANRQGPTLVGEEVGVLKQAPNVPPPIKRSHATKVIVTLEVKEVVRRLSDGVDYLFWTFGGEVPGTYILVDHSLFRAFNKGALGMLKVAGPKNLLVYSGKEVDAVYLGKQRFAESAAKRRRQLPTHLSEGKVRLPETTKLRTRSAATHN